MSKRPRGIDLSIPIPSLEGQFGERLNVYQCLVRPSDVRSLLGHDPRSKNWKTLPEDLQRIYGYLQRKTTGSRKASLSRYITERIVGTNGTIGAFPALAIGMTEPARFEPDSEDSPVGTLHYDLSGRVRRVLLDGLGRVTAAMDLLDSNVLSVDEQITFMVTIYAPSPSKGELTLEELGQLFHDFNFLAEPVSRGQAVDLDQSNLYITLTNLLARTPVIKDHGGMEPRAASLGKKSTALVAKQVLLKFVRAGCEGDTRAAYTLRQNPEGGTLDINNLPHIRDRMEWFLKVLAARMGDSFEDKESLHLSAPGWAALGILFHDLEFRLKDELSDGERLERIEAIGDLDWSRYNLDWINYLGGEELDKEGRKRLGSVFGGRAIERVVEYVRHRVGIPDPKRDSDASPEGVLEP